MQSILTKKKLIIQRELITDTLAYNTTIIDPLKF
jgi:hypothetical protein